MTGVAQGSADGPKKIFGRENVNWQGPQKASEGAGRHASKSSASDDFTYSRNNPEYVQAIHQAFIDEDGVNSFREDIVASAVINRITSSSKAYSKEDLGAITGKFEEHFNNFAKSEKGMELIGEELESALEDGYELIDMDKSTDIDIVVDEDEKDRFLNDGGLRSINRQFQQYVSDSEEEKQNRESFESLVENAASFNPEGGFDEDEYERLRLQDANDRGYDSIEEYEEDLENAEFEYAERRGVDIARDLASSVAMESYINSTSPFSSPAEAAEAKQYYRELFDQYYNEGTNSETVHYAALSMNSSYEVVDVRDGDLEVNKEQEDQWASSDEFDYLNRKFTEYATKHPFKR